MTIISMAMGPGPPGDDDWLACEHPERPYDMGIRWHLIQHCRACNVRYQVDRLHMKPQHRAIMDGLL